MDQALLQLSPLIVGLLSNRLIVFAKWSQALPFWKGQKSRIRLLLTGLSVAGIILSAGLDGSLAELAQSPGARGLIEQGVKVAFAWAVAHFTHKYTK